ncbi:SH3 domain-containing protein [Notoacmeibacter sp. MSK16QG-6]|uniref:SH3 domain-containing protein n=1 Tax=Notoacmeibacter sp. MSK16QG-6 TaxID=2957982 RepID=UPI00209E39C9
MRARAGMNVRSGPGVDYGRVGSMAEDARGELMECTPQGRWCRVRTANATGWIAGSFLIVDDGELAGSRVRDVVDRITFSEGNGGVARTASTERGTDSGSPAETATGAGVGTEGVCFYSEYDNAGDADCHDKPGEAITLGRTWNDRIASVTIADGYAVTVCDNYGLTGRCAVFKKSVERMPAALNERISSWRIEKAN